MLRLALAALVASGCAYRYDACAWLCREPLKHVHPHGVPSRFVPERQACECDWPDGPGYVQLGVCADDN